MHGSVTGGRLMPVAILLCIPQRMMEMRKFHQRAHRRTTCPTCNPEIASMYRCLRFRPVAARYCASMRLSYEARVTLKKPHLLRFATFLSWMARSRNRHIRRHQFFIYASLRAPTTTNSGFSDTRRMCRQTKTRFVKGVTCLCRKQKGRGCSPSLFFCFC
jgi:hypothetical protein